MPLQPRLTKAKSRQGAQALKSREPSQRARAELGYPLAASWKEAFPEVCREGCSDCNAGAQARTGPATPYGVRGNVGATNYPGLSPGAVFGRAVGACGVARVGAVGRDDQPPQEALSGSPGIDPRAGSWADRSGQVGCPEARPSKVTSTSAEGATVGSLGRAPGIGEPPDSRSSEGAAERGGPRIRLVTLALAPPIAGRRPAGDLPCELVPFCRREGFRR